MGAKEALLALYLLLMEASMVAAKLCCSATRAVMLFWVS